jgi:hypothetical protein
MINYQLQMALIREAQDARACVVGIVGRIDQAAVEITPEHYEILIKKAHGITAELKAIEQFVRKLPAQ